MTVWRCDRADSGRAMADTQLLAGGLRRNRAYLHLITVQQRREHGRNTQGSHCDLSFALTVTERLYP